MKTVLFTARGWLYALAGTSILAAAFPAGANTVPNPIIFVTQVPVEETANTVTSVGGNHLATTAAAPRGGDLMIWYPDGMRKNLTRLAGYGEAETLQGGSSIAVRDPCIHWSGKRALFSMVVGTAHAARWEMYEVTGLGLNDTPIITKVLTPAPSRPSDGTDLTTGLNLLLAYNNVQPCYASDDKIIFVSDRPREGMAHLYPARDEKEASEINTGLWQLDTVTGVVTQLEHSPSGSFDPFVDSFGRIVFSRWDHLQREEVVAPGRFDFSSEASDATRVPGVWTDLYPEPLATPANPFGLTFDQFLPWTLNQDGTGLVTINHLGRHELTPAFNATSPDKNLQSFVPSSGSVRAGSFLQIREDRLAGRYVATDALFTAVSAGKLISFFAPPTRGPEKGALISILSNTGLARDPAILTTGRLMASVSGDLTIGAGSYGKPPSTPEPVPRTFIPDVAKPFKILTAVPGASPPNMFRLDYDIVRTVTNTVRGQKRTFSGALWELQPVEVVASARPPVAITPMDVPELEVFSQTGVSPAVLRAWMAANDLAVISCRNVTTRDAADTQQPTSLKVEGGVHTFASGNDPVYSVASVQFFQADYVRGYGLSSIDSAPDVGRRVAARPMHDDKGANPSTPKGPGSVKVSTDGSMAAFVPARRALSWQLEDPIGKPVVRERYWLSFQAGEIRSCTSCHGVNATDQAGDPVSTNPPQALRDLLGTWKQAHPDAAAGSFRVWSEGVLGATLDPAADTDGDGASNFEEYATGSSPVAQPPAGQRNHLLEATRQTIIGIAGKEVNVLTFRRLTTAYRLETTVQSSDDMTSWTEAAHFDSTSRRSAPDFAVGTTSSDTPNVEIIHLVDLRANTASRRFYRLRLEAP